MIKYDSNNISKMNFSGNTANKAYFGGNVCFQYMSSDAPEPPTPPAFNGKWKATYIDETVVTAECDSSSATSENEITKANLKTLVIGDCVTEFGQNTIRNCGTLETITFSDSVQSIDSRAVYNCTSLKTVEIGSGINNLGPYSLRNCSSLQSITIKAITPPSIGGFMYKSTVFANTNNCPIYVPAESVNAYKGGDWSDYASRIRAIPNS